MSEEKMSAETYVVSGGRPAHEHDAPVNPPIILSSTYRGAGTVDTVSDKVYARFANPTWEAMEAVARCVRKHAGRKPGEGTKARNTNVGHEETLPPHPLRTQREGSSRTA